MSEYLVELSGCDGTTYLKADQEHYDTLCYLKRESQLLSEHSCHPTIDFKPLEEAELHELIYLEVEELRHRYRQGEITAVECVDLEDAAEERITLEYKNR